MRLSKLFMCCKPKFMRSVGACICFRTFYYFYKDKRRLVQRKAIYHKRVCVTDLK